MHFLLINFHKKGKKQFESQKKKWKKKNPWKEHNWLNTVLCLDQPES